MVSFIHSMTSMALYVGVAAWWVMPTRAMRRVIADLNASASGTE